jgi:uncharacterized membrane protein YiaA
MYQKPSAAFIAASWIALGTGVIGYLIGLYRAEMLLNEKGYYFTVLMFGLFSVVSLQKSVRDKLEKIPVTDLYYGICWFVTILVYSFISSRFMERHITSKRKRVLCFLIFSYPFLALLLFKKTRETVKLKIQKINNLEITRT